MPNFCFLPYFVLNKTTTIVEVAQKVFNNLININISFQQLFLANFLKAPILLLKLRNLNIKNLYLC